MAEEKGADRLPCDPQGFLKSAKTARLPALPDIDMVEFDTREFLENARAQRYFAPNRIISKSERGKWRFVARQLYKDWCLLAAAHPDNRAPCSKQKIAKSGCANMKPFASNNHPLRRIGRKLSNRHSIRANSRLGAFEAARPILEIRLKERAYDHSRNPQRTEQKTMPQRSSVYLTSDAFELTM